ncbi:MAG: AAA family ATPase [Solirubrobacteraceae bacterium]
MPAKQTDGHTHGPPATFTGLVERDLELARLHEALSRAAEGAGTVTFVESPPGTGRSRLLEAAAGAAREADARLLQGRGRDTERLFGFGVALQLFEKHWLAADGEEQAQLFHGPAQPANWLIADPARVPGEEPPASPFPIIHGLFCSIRNMARPTAGAVRSQPLAVLVDDLHDADGPSLAFLAYLGARISDLPIALVVALRTGATATDADAVRALRATADTLLHPAELSSSAATRIAQTTFPDGDAVFWEGCADVSGGNPFLLHTLLEEVRRLRPQLVPGAVPTLPEHVPEGVVRWIGSQLATLPRAASSVASAVAALTGPTALSHVATVAGLGPDEAARAADVLADIGLLRPGAPLSFTHAIVARAVLQSIPDLERELLERRAGGGERPPEHPRAAPTSSPVSVDGEVQTIVAGETPPPPGERVKLADLAIESGLRGEHRTRVAKLGELAWGDGAIAEAGGTNALVAARVGQALLLVDELELGLEILADGGQPPPDSDQSAAFDGACCRSWMLYHRGEVVAAMTAASTALDARPAPTDAARHGLHAVLAACLIQLSELEPADAALDVLNAPDEILDPGVALLLDIRAQLSLARSRPEDALADALEAGRRAHALSGAAPPGLVAWRSTAALAQLALEEPARARDLAEEELELARSSGVTRATLRGLRVVGLASTGKARLELLEQAVALGAEAPPRLEYLHALVDLGAATRRANRRAAARQPLTTALELARELGVAAIARRAEDEIAAGAGRRRRPRATGTQALTPGERRVALLAAEGRTTRQIAGELYVTPKTVEFHLRHIYRKLGVPSTRAALPAVFQGDDAAPGSF